ncbi:hypothetical protein [Haloterrigena salifodinae]|uniref:hypothetical protein n=1 Tax=Haloterrigena salifodinae TaxID=2675099 RepID=UPI000F870CBB|nr:hypothetical protein [Haloterrigena salifodinae]
MSANGNGEDDEEIPGREVAYRLFAAEYDDASFSYAESDEERAPNYVISPTGARLNRVFTVGTLTEITAVNDEMVRARVVDPTGAFVVYAGQYQPDELATLEQLEPPEFVAVTGKARTFQPDDSDQVYTSLRPESIATVDADTRDRWVVSAAEQTVERVGTYAAAVESGTSGEALTDALLEAGVDKGLAAGIPLAQDHYGTTPDYLAALRDCALEAVEVVAGERDQVEAFSLSPEDSSPDADASFASLADLVDLDLEGLETAPAVETGSDSDSEPEPEPEPAAATAGTGSAAGTATSTDREASTTDVEVESEEADAVESESETEPPTESTPESADPAAETTEATPTGTGVTDAEADATADVAATDDPSATDSEPAKADTGLDETDLDESETTDEATEADVNLESDTETGADLETGAETDEDLGDFDADDVGDGGMYEMDEEEREQLEEEFGAEFTTGAEVKEPGEADIDVPEPDDEPVDEFETESEAAADATTSDELDASDEAETESADDLGAPPSSGLEADAEAEPDEDDATAESAATEPDEGATDDSEEESAADVDLEDYVVETMEDLDDGDGADRTELVERVADETGAAEGEVEDAIQDALMGGQCYEPDDETLKAI